MVRVSKLQGKTVTIVGLGLMGGSLAMALRSHGVRLVAVEPDQTTREQALARKLVDKATPELAGGVRAAELVVLAAPVGAILELLPAVAAARPDGCAILDLGSTKGAVMAAMDRLPPPMQAVGGHPMCGKEQAGLAAAEPGLFGGQTFFLCRGLRTGPEGAALAEELVAAVGAEPWWIEPEEHDHLVALVSHLPYFAAAALMAEAAEAASSGEPVWRAAAGGFRDTVRLAGSDPRMMADIVRTNRQPIVAALQNYRDRLDEIMRLLETGDENALLRWLAARQREHRLYRGAEERA
jgi:prephenate dehydrogenase